MTRRPPRLLPCGDTAFTIEFGDAIDADLNAAVLALDAVLAEAALPGVVETVPTYRSLTVHCDPVAVDPAELGQEILALARSDLTPPHAGRIWRIPVVYGGEFGADLDAVAEHHGLSSGDVIARHAEPDYRVAMLGFLPGYAYLSGLDPTLALSRRPSPRPITPAGTISIGGAQALVASIAAPSGWHLLGRTPVRSFMPGRDPIFLLAPGDRVRFEPVDPGRWTVLDEAAAAGELVAERLDG
ncbi:5-oxoprolinase subunit PxpB [Methylobacterium haplocladii]|uniref:Allophanate hydrolase n=1 Tax=Methylobacterium haplocladii TaxID=1176176 RepID=A0A512IRP9_9HYPH|nr:5-oxoprolinase subunit PxpB [Methylobacterium haplocladii]GEP00299.1 allophanate hydrolase [Methylobacterium haplocladii]GJD86070.1 5-oxoprolinase subunit B [Methylobacterium haplocladii]GLS59789.1 allophanate hydrolase [Methylobacterium haplocladii]